MFGKVIYSVKIYFIYILFDNNVLILIFCNFYITNYYPHLCFLLFEILNKVYICKKLKRYIVSNFCFDLICDLNYGFSEVFRDPSIRRKFIQKVYALLSLQLLFTFSIVSVFVFR